MKANIEVICYKYKPLKDGTLPLMLRVTKDRKRKYVSLGLSLHEKCGRIKSVSEIKFTNKDVTRTKNMRRNFSLTLYL